MSERLFSTTAELHIASTAKPTYKFCITNRAGIKEMLPVTCFLNTEADIIVKNSSMIHPSRGKRVRRESKTKLRITTKQAMKLDGSILVHLCIGGVCTRVWFSIARHLAVNIQIVITFIDHVIRRTFAAEPKVVLWHSPPHATLTRYHQKNMKPH